MQVLSVLGVGAVAITVALLAYGREELTHSGAPEAAYYQVNWGELVDTTVLDLFLQVSTRWN